jgi:hypothetical protein
MLLKLFGDLFCYSSMLFCFGPSFNGPFQLSEFGDSRAVVAAKLEDESKIRDLSRKAQIGGTSALFAMFELSSYGKYSLAAREGLYGVLTSKSVAPPSIENRLYAGILLAEIGDPAVPYLERALHRGDSVSKQIALQALAEIGPNAMRSMPLILRCCFDSDFQVKRHARSAFWKVLSVYLNKVPAR